MTVENNDTKIERMRATNEKQKAHYNTISTSGWYNSENSWATVAWTKLRHRAMHGVAGPAREKVYTVHKQWLGDISQKKVLELGAGSGCPLSVYLGRNAYEYHANDLSGEQLAKLRRKIGERNRTRFLEGDILDARATDDDYDVIYAHAVLHHFRHLDTLLDILENKLAPGGILISYDPSQVWLPMRIFRLIYRPFQTDADWEFPFTKKSMQSIETRFLVVERLGVFRTGKWALVIAMLSPELGRRFGDRLFLKDFDPSLRSSSFGSSLHVSYFLKRKAADQPTK